jgi:hypothetical protein
MPDSIFCSAVAVSAYILYLLFSSLVSVRQKVRLAKETGLSYFVRPVLEFNYVYLLLQPVITNVLSLVPTWLDSNGYRNYFENNWRFLQKWQPHEQYGPIYWNISPGGMLLEIADAKVYMEIMSRRLDFTRDLSVLGTYGEPSRA